MSTWRRQLAKDSASVVAATAIAQVVLVVTGMITKRLLGPTNVAAWSLGTALLSYMALLQLGVLDALLLRLPLLHVRGHARFRRLVCPAIVWLLGIACFAILCLLLVALYQVISHRPLNGVGVALVMPLVVPFLLVTLCVTLARARGDFSSVAAATIANAVASGVGAVLLVHWFGLIGQGVGFALGILVQLFVYSRYLTCERELWRMIPSITMGRTIKALIRRGFPWQSGSALLVMRQALDTVLSVTILGPVAAGVYALGASFRTYAVALPTAFGTVLFRSLRIRHADGNSTTSEGWLDAFEMNALLLVIPSAAVLSLAGPVLLGWAFPNFGGISRLVAIVPVAAAPMMMEPIAYQRILAGGATTAFRGLALVSLVLMGIGTVPGLLSGSVLVLGAGVGAAAVVSLGVTIHATLANSNAERLVRRRVWILLAAVLSVVGLVAALGLTVEEQLVPLSSTISVVACITLAGSSVGLGMWRLKQMRSLSDA